MRHLRPVNVIISLDHTIEPVFSMHHHQRHFIFIRKKDSGMPIHHFLKSRFLPSSIMPRKRLATSSVMCSFLIPTFVFVDSIISFIFVVRWSWWPMLRILFQSQHPAVLNHSPSSAP